MPTGHRDISTCSEEAEFEPQRPCIVSQDINTLCKDVTKETSRRHQLDKVVELTQGKFPLLIS
ncbi:hypothetical protein EYF80_040288 [Liparis tanakae]|uniref:Uncharacterized protein n=1 Tax=Liparis tanakae TaxID=230148 RepID=A0A4Z2G9J0_9TELE|nr:hypothetical protein EYF80_040288 [Liparis tanakae]